MYFKNCLLILVMLFLSGLLKSQTLFHLSDYQMIRNSIVAQKSFFLSSNLYTSCGNDFLLKELMNVQLTGQLVVRDNVLCMQMSHNGYSKYGNLTTSIAYARQFGKKVAVGLRFYYLYQHVEQYEPTHSVTFDISLFAFVTKKLSFGFEVYNPARLKYGFRGTNLIPMKFTVQAQYKYSDKLLFMIDLYKRLPGEFDVSLGAYYHPLNYFYLAFDVSLMYADIGVMLRCGHFYFTIDLKYNYRLGFSPEVGLVYQFQRLKK